MRSSSSREKRRVEIILWLNGTNFSSVAYPCPSLAVSFTFPPSLMYPSPIPTTCSPLSVSSFFYLSVYGDDMVVSEWEKTTLVKCRACSVSVKTKKREYSKSTVIWHRWGMVGCRVSKNFSFLRPAAFGWSSGSSGWKFQLDVEQQQCRVVAAAAKCESVSCPSPPCVCPIPSPPPPPV